MAKMRIRCPWSHIISNKANLTLPSTEIVETFSLAKMVPKRLFKAVEQCCLMFVKYSLNIVS